jgi:lysophospholipase L1-like esterase
MSLQNQISDAFQRVAGSLGANWTNYNNGFAASNHAIGTAVGTSLNITGYTGTTFTDDQSSTVVVGTLNGTTDQLGAAVRISGTPGASTSCYVAQQDTSFIKLYKVVGATSISYGSLTLLGSVAISGSNGDTIKLTAVGDVLVVDWNTTKGIIVAADTTVPLMTGIPGIDQNGNVGTIASFSATGVGSPTADDAFQRTAGTLGANWTNILNGFAAANKATGTTAAQLNVATYTGASFTNDQSSTVVIKTYNGSSDFPGPAVRITKSGSNASYYVADADTTLLSIQKIVNATATSVGTLTTLASTAFSGVNGDTITLHVVGNTLWVDLNGTRKVLQIADSTLATGVPGISIYGNVSTLSYFSAQSEAAFAGAALNVATVGDSITEGTGVLARWSDSLTVTKRSPFSISNMGIDSQGLNTTISSESSMTAIATASVDSLYVPGIANVIVLWGGTNDMATSGRTPAQLYADVQTYVAARKAIGWKVVIVPNLSRNGDDTDQQTYNSLVSGGSTFYDALVSLPSTLVANGAYSNTTYFQAGGIHPTQFSDLAIIAPAISVAIDSLLGLLPTSIAPTSGKQNQTLNVTVTGTSFSTGTLSFSGTGITVNSYSVQNSTTVTASIAISGSAALTARDVIITNADTTTGTLAAAFTITVPGVASRCYNTAPTTTAANTVFNVTLLSTDSFDVASNVILDTAVVLTVYSGTGALSGVTTGVILAGTHTATITGVVYSKVEAGVSFMATSTSGDSLAHFLNGLTTTFTASTAYSSADSRAIATYPTTPNTSRNVSGTKIYDVQTSSNAAVPSVDSQTAGAPVDSQTNIPANSRTPGTYGPNN